MTDKGVIEDFMTFGVNIFGLEILCLRRPSNHTTIV